MADAIVLDGVTKSFGPKLAVDALDMVVPQGGLYGFIGPNGAGKTTAIRMIMSMLFPDHGGIAVLGHTSALHAKDRIGYLPEERGVYKKMKVGTFLSYVARLKGYTAPDLRSKIRGWLERLGLGEVENQKCEELSKGMQQKVQFISTVLHEPDLLILDEPFSGLDPVAMRLLRDLVIEQHRRGCTIIFSTHVMSQAEQICEHIIMINQGGKVLDDSLARIRARYDPRTLLLEPRDPGVDLELLSVLPAVREVKSAKSGYEISLVDGIDPCKVMAEIVQKIPALRIELSRPTLEDIFVQIVGGEAGTTDAENAENTENEGSPAEVEA